MEDFSCSLSVRPHLCSWKFKRMYRLLTHVQYDIALVLTSVENLICTSIEDFSCSLSIRPHLCSWKFKGMYCLLILVQYNVALLLYHDRSARWDCLSIDTLRSIDPKLLDYQTRSRWNCLSIDTIRSIDPKLLDCQTRSRSRLLEYWYRTIVPLKIAWLSHAIDWVLISCLTIDLCVSWAIENW